MNELATGGTAYAILDLTPGRYGFVSFVVDPATGRPHVDLGMMAELAVT